VKRRLDLALFAALWLLAMALFASFWFDIKFNFNIFSLKHWAYLAKLQTGTEVIKPEFYFFLTVFSLLAVTGTYVILHHRHRKIIAMMRENEQAKIDAERVAAASVSSNQNNWLQKPQRIITSAQMTQNVYPAATEGGVLKPTIASTTVSAVPTKPKESEKSDTEKQLETILVNANFKPKKLPKIGGRHPSVFAIGADEVLLIGLVQKTDGEVTVQEGPDAIWTDRSGTYPSPVGIVSDMTIKLQALFGETLDPSLSINVRPFVVLEDGKDIKDYDDAAHIWNAYGVMVFRGLRELYDVMLKNPGDKVKFEERDDFEAYSEYIDTVIEYFDSRG
jgi:hypothetical protein